MFDAKFPDAAKRYPNDHYAKWEPKNRRQTNSLEAAEQILLQTGRLPRPLRLADVKLNAPPLKKVIVANPQERRKVAEMAVVYAVTRLQAKLLIRRVTHRVWGHERVMVYGNMLADYIQPDANTNEPFEKQMKLKFKAAFREDFDPFFPTLEQKWEERLEETGMRPDLVEGKKIENLLKKTGANSDTQVPENMFCEAILDNVVDLGELVVQHFACLIDKQEVSPEGKKHRLNKRLEKRLTKTLGVETSWDVKDEEYVESSMTPQEKHDATADYEDLRLKSFFRTKNAPQAKS